MSARRGDVRGEDGFALVLVLLFLLIVSALLTPLVLAARTDFMVAANTYRQDRFEIMAEGIVTLIARELAAPPTEARNPEIELRSVPLRCETGRLRVEAHVQDQRGLADLNAGEEDLLEAAFIAVGIDRSEASTLARTAIAFRTLPEQGDDVTGADPKIVVDGLKRAPFEAIEELYDFRGFSNVPARALLETFTIHGEQPTIVGEQLSGRLAEILPDEPTGQYPFVVTEQEEGPGTYYIDATVSAAGTGVSGFAGSIILATGNENGQFEVVERVTNPEFLGDGNDDFGDAVPCDRLFGTDIAAVLATAAQ